MVMSDDEYFWVRLKRDSLLSEVQDFRKNQACISHTSSNSHDGDFCRPTFSMTTRDLPVKVTSAVPYT